MTLCTWDPKCLPLDRKPNNNITSVGMNLVDNFKLRAIISEAITSLRFLDTVKPQDDISSELAGFEISKLLKNQEDN